MHAVSAASALVIRATCKYTFELTQMRNHMHAVSAASALVTRAYLQVHLRTHTNEKPYRMQSVQQVL